MVVFYVVAWKIQDGVQNIFIIYTCMFEYCFNFKVKIKYEIFGEKGKLHSCLLLFYQLTKIGKIVL